MYCKYCGKQIDDNSIFCNHCGKKQSEGTKPIIIPDIKADQTPLLYHFNNFSKKAKIYIASYAIWVALNGLIWALSDSHCGSRFYPFGYANIDAYDGSEFLVYTILLPLFIFGVIQLFPYLKKWFKNLNEKK